MDAMRNIIEREKEAPHFNQKIEDLLATDAGKELAEQVDRTFAAAAKIVRENSEVQPLIFALTSDRQKGVILPMGWASEEERSYKIAMTKIAFLACAIESYTSITEGWGCEPEHYDPEIRNADNPHRFEILMCVGVNRAMAIGKQMRIDVDADGDRILVPLQHDGDNIPEFTIAGGDLAKLLPPAEVAAEMDETKREMLRKNMDFELMPYGKAFGN